MNFLCHKKLAGFRKKSKNEGSDKKRAIPYDLGFS
jgi:hypothetical protein